ncbi:macrolide transport system ATP-binding/permease protein [Streptoalloteichus tenebrarius]|uniref:Macrolide transport system ATP-binding/permease protein n=1 Tax=Streptoalloteichus tenebrarius (strain ATCC 17920 / DSM 40477 / JCM 4838 / CBS 697.72 / NBRC 16177 / NCIMB 11028 / NRRL B-12390 / A12253. 1 / ISP 5477) TaxID=1933 RepID=A0ABT1HQ87_STRSD|nr:TlrC/CarA/OleB/SrmB family ABC-F type ribosomal protection protein [Streptoalloteichus tenebrarius]MCP2257662.1 macrolide transport system ATP-binding/permease protein [Streptoalloteichus tenebrarius]BFE98623.1 ABC-F family ATP-binding cassette domain-containing protein [Streptoalloteichus tenebrarius]
MQNSVSDQPRPHTRAGSFQVVLDDVVRAPGGRPLLDGVRQSVALGERIGVIGENGSGKSTLLRLLAGLDQPDQGRVVVHAPGGVGYLPQTPDLPPEDTVRDAIDHALAELRALERDLRETERALTQADPDDLEGLLARYADLLEAFEARDGYTAEARVHAATHGLGLAHITAERRLGTLSGGEQARLSLACLLAASPQLMVLDEPTNHLDVGALAWLEEHLRGHRGSVLVVSHDRVFLERVATALWEVDGERRTVRRHGGGYAGYLQARAAARRRWEQRYQEWREDLARQRELVRVAAENLAAGPRRTANADRRNGRHQRDVEKQVSARVRHAKERVRVLEANPVPRPPQPLRFRARVDTDPTRRGVLAGLDRVRVGDRLDVPAFTVEAGQRVLVTGPNGAGKSTLLRVLAGDLEPDRGGCVRPRRIGWLPQDTRITDPRRNVLEAFAAGRPGLPDDHRETLLGFGLFAPSALSTPVGALSTGQLRRLALARVLRDPVDLLLLDEPTNHLSPALVEDLEEALAGYEGALVVVSHDRMFAQRFTGERLRMEAGRLVD